MSAPPERRGGASVLAAAAAVGFVLWFLASAFVDRREAWDSGLYWIAFYPLALAACGFFGLRYPDRPWRFALAVFFGQCLALGIRNGELGNLFPLGLITFGVIALPGIALAFIASKAGQGARTGTGADR
jgi:hypothetical protein